MRLTAALSVLVLAACSSYSMDESPIATNIDLKSELGLAFPSSSKLEGAGYVLKVGKLGGTVYETVSGAADIEQRVAITPETVFHIASLSKQITAAALVHAIEDELVSLDDSVGYWVPEAEKYGDSLRVVHLVYMTSGLTEYTALPRVSGHPWATFHYFTTREAIESSLAVDKLQFNPGTAWQYSNINYMLIAEIVASAYKLPFRQVVRSKIFEPLGMTASLVNDDVTTPIPNRANAYLPRTDSVLTQLRNGAGIDARDHPELVLIRRNAPHYGGSGVMTNMIDWSKWQTEMLAHAKFGEPFWSLMFRRQNFQHDKTNDAFGLVHGKLNGHETLWYSGGDIDASTYSVTVPKLGVYIACFSNNPLDSCEEKVLQAVEILARHSEI